MDDYDFRKIDKEMEKRLDRQAQAAPKLPMKSILIPIGEYDGNNLLPGCIILDSSYTVWLEVSNW